MRMKSFKNQARFQTFNQRLNSLFDNKRMIVETQKAWCNEVLTDDKKKKLYDKCGKKCVDEAEQDGAQGGG